ncbi:hypothetical protein RYX36_032795 [Vicia faba]
MAGSAAWLGRSLSCICVQRRDSDASSFFYLTLAREECLQRLQRRIHVPYDSSIIEHQDIDKKDVSLSKFKGKVLLIVNVASRWAHSQYPFQRTKLHHICVVYFEWPSERTVGKQLREKGLAID